MPAKPTITGDDADALAGVLAGEHNGRSLPASDADLRKLWKMRAPSAPSASAANLAAIRASARRLGLV